MSAVDYSKPLATLLREGTRETHNAVNQSPGAKLLSSGELPKQEYARYLMMLWHVYHALERALDRHAADPSLELTYNPTLLVRAPSLSADISYFLQVDESSWKSHPLNVGLIASSPALCAYLRRIEEISDSPDPSTLLAHSYVRYLGDLSGGQRIRHALCKAYDLDEATGLGVSCYAFKELRSLKPASQEEMKRIKDWFKDGLNAAGERDIQVKAAVLEEARRAFGLNSDLLGLIGVHDEHPPPSFSFSLASVVTFIAAACLAHFILVTGGFTGDNGYQKLLGMSQWFTDLRQQTSD